MIAMFILWMRYRLFIHFKKNMFIMLIYIHLDIQLTSALGFDTFDYYV